MNKKTATVLSLLLSFVVTCITGISACSAPDKCIGTHCLYSGRCFEGDCTCVDGTTGKHCEKLRLTGDWTGRDVEIYYDNNEYDQTISVSDTVARGKVQLIFSNIAGRRDTTIGTLTEDDPQVVSYHYTVRNGSAVDTIRGYLRNFPGGGCEHKFYYAYQRGIADYYEGNYTN